MAELSDELTVRLNRRMAELADERKLSPLPPVVVGAALVVPMGLINKIKGTMTEAEVETFAEDTGRVEAIAMAAIMETERRLGYVPHDVSAKKLGWDIESSIPGTGRLRFIEVKGRVAGAATVTVTRNEIITGLNKPDDFILALVEVDGDSVKPRYVWRPFNSEPDFAATSVNYDLKELLAKAAEPQ
jgi:hypothetical protein